VPSPGTDLAGPPWFYIDRPVRSSPYLGGRNSLSRGIAWMPLMTTNCGGNDAAAILFEVRVQV